MVLFTGTYVLNLLCAIVPCHGTMRPPEAYIAQASSPENEVNVAGQLKKLDLSANQTAIIDPVESASNIVKSLQRSKRLHNFTFSEEAQDEEPSFRFGATEISIPRKRTEETITGPRYPNLVNPLRTMMSALQKGFQRAGGFTHNFGNAYVPFPEETKSAGGKRNVRDHTGSLGVKQPDETTVYLRNGDAVQGYYMGTMKGRRFMGFQGIPYAEPPIGNLRFKPPVPKRSWRGLLKATRTGNKCLQGHPAEIFRISGSEDCLFLNIYTHKTSSSLNKDKLLPVIFFIHGGSFMYGSGAEYGPAYLLDQDVVLVTFNYRLGALGFLSTDDVHSPGNYGLKDQALALKWVHENIEQFGGDPKRITLLGQSAGGVSAHIHLLANQTTKYFQSGISLSGSVFGFWPVVEKTRALGFTKRLAKSLRCPQDDSAKLVQCLRGIRSNYIIGATLHFFKWIPFHPLIVFAPVIEPDVPTAYFTKHPEELYAAGEVAKKPWIFGQTSQEGHFETYMINLFVQTPVLTARVNDLLPIILDYQDFTKEPNTSRITRKIMNFYGANKHHGFLQGDTSKLMEAVSDMYTDRIFTNTIQTAIRHHGSIAPTYAYIFDFMGSSNLGQVFGAAKSEWGVVHTEDLFFIFNSSLFHHGFKRSDPEYQLSEVMTNLVANFAKTKEPLYTDLQGKDVRIWEPAISNELSNNGSGSSNQNGINSLPIRYLQLKQVIDMIPDPYTERNQFWKTLGIKL